MTPPNVTATRTSNGAIRITWTAPETDGGDPVTRWMVNLHDGKRWLGARNFTNATHMRNYLWTKAPRGNTRVAVLAHNNAGPSAWAYVNVPAT